LIEGIYPFGAHLYQKLPFWRFWERPHFPSNVKFGTERQRAGYYVRDVILYRNYKYLGQNYEQLVLPVNRRQEVIKLAHEIYSSHLGDKKTKERIKLSFTWPIIASDVQRACETCHQYQKKRWVAVCDSVSHTYQKR